MRGLQMSLQNLEPPVGRGIHSHLALRLLLSDRKGPACGPVTASVVYNDRCKIATEDPAGRIW